MNYEIGPILMQPDPLRPGFSYKEIGRAHV